MQGQQFDAPVAANIKQVHPSLYLRLFLQVMGIQEQLRSKDLHLKFFKQYIRCRTWKLLKFNVRHGLLAYPGMAFVQKPYGFVGLSSACCHEYLTIIAWGLAFGHSIATQCIYTECLLKYTRPVVVAVSDIVPQKSNWKWQNQHHGNEHNR